jgi:hypothetical protein
MITTIQEKELDLWENMKVVERVFGKDSIQAKYNRAAWNSVWGLMKDMGIETLDRDVR